MTDCSTGTEPSLGDLFARYGTDKGSAPAAPWQWPMGYERVYGPLLDPIRHAPVTMLELGWGEYDPDRGDHSNPDVGGRSARAWSDYFDHPDSQVHVVDITPKTFPDQQEYQRVHLWQGSQDDPDFLGHLHWQSGDYDLIIDDASHVSSLTVASFKILWPYLKPGGLYVVEDLHSSYHWWWFGEQEAAEDPACHEGKTAVAFLKRLADEAFFNGVRVKGPKVDGKRTADWDCYPRRYWMGYAVESVSFHAPQMCVVRKRLVSP
jgi:hypothetical protein